jgi:hypothetical protein
MNGVTPLMQAATQMHELFTEYVRAGFTPEQAMQLLCASLGRNE